MRPILSAMISVSGLKLTQAEKKLLSHMNPMGITLFRRNIKSPAQVKKLIGEIKEALQRKDVLIAIDQEGGRVCRLKPPHWHAYVSQSALVSLPKRESEELVRLHALLIADELNSLGINWNYAPVLDVLHKNTTRALLGRCFSDDEKAVAHYGKILAKTYMEQGICPCIKHLPGHGPVAEDSHFDLPHLNQKLKDLEKDFYPFKKLAKVIPVGMTAHLLIPALDKVYPITESKKGIQFIRKKLGFSGFLISDALGMKALKGTLKEKTKKSLAAGCDAVCYCGGNVQESEEVLKASVPLTGESLARFKKIQKICQTKPTRYQISTLRKRYRQLARHTIKTHDYDVVESLHK